MITAIGSDGKTRTYAGTTSTEINQALNHKGVITLDPTITYNIKDSLLFSSNTTLDGNGATIKLSKGLSTWGYRNAPISQEKALLMIKGNSASNVVIKNLTVDGSQADYYPNIKLGTSCFNLGTLIGCKGLTIENCTFKNGCNDGILLNKCSNINIKNCSFNKTGHDGIYAYGVSDINVDSCKFVNRTNSSCRFYNVSNGKFTNCISSTSGGGFTGVELQGTLKNITIKGNKIYKLPYPGIVSLGAKMSNVLIEGNLISGCKKPGISVVGAILKNNEIKY